MKLKTRPVDVETLAYWMKERHDIYLRREKGKPKPWTKDSILQSYRFCNVFRELDTVTVWIRENWREPYADHDNLWFAMVVARLINWPPTLEKLGFPKRRSWFNNAAKILEKMHENGEQIYGPAYIISTNGRKMIKWKYTLQILKNIYIDPPTFSRISKLNHSLENMWKQLIEFDGIGRFIGYEVVTDLRHTRYYEESIGDHLTWANAGPGAFRGLSRLWDGDIEHKPTPKEALKRMRWLLAELPKYLPRRFPEIEMRDVEHSLCEVDKYLRVKLNQGRPKCKYEGR